MDIKIKRVSGDTTEQVKVTGASEEIVDKLIRHFYPKDEVEPKLPHIEHVPNPTVFNPKTDIVPMKANGPVKIDEKVSSDPQPKSKYAEPVRVQDDVELYVIEIDCCACKAETHTRLTSTRNYFVKCKECGQKLVVEQMYDELLRANKRGIAFFANAPYYTDYELHKLEHEMSDKHE